jgi:hypothetical protein
VNKLDGQAKASNVETNQEKAKAHRVEPAKRNKSCFHGLVSLMLVVSTAFFLNFGRNKRYRKEWNLYAEKTVNRIPAGTAFADLFRA